MRSRAARLTSATAALIGLVAACAFIFQTERTLAERRSAARAFDVKAHEAAAAFADTRAALQAYVAAGQGVGLWMPRLDALLETSRVALDRLRQTAGTPDARFALIEAGASVAELVQVDKRVRDYLSAGQSLMAADVVFAEGVEAVATAGRLLDAARLAEEQALEGSHADARRQETGVGVAAAGLVALVVVLLALVRPAGGDAAEVEGDRTLSLTFREDAPGLSRLATPQPVVAAPPADPPRASVPGLKAAAALCTELSRVKDMDDLRTTLGRAADAMDASGIVLWMGDGRGADLRPVLAHGYPPHALAKLPLVPRSGDNAAAAAYRTGLLQIVLARPGSSNGAVVAPLLSPEGCIGALTAEIRSGGETSDSAQALAAILAAQLASVVAAPAQAVETLASRAASA